MIITSSKIYKIIHNILKLPTTRILMWKIIRLFKDGRLKKGGLRNGSGFEPTFLF